MCAFSWNKSPAKRQLSASALNIQAKTHYIQGNHNQELPAEFEKLCRICICKPCNQRRRKHCRLLRPWQMFSCDALKGDGVEEAQQIQSRQSCNVLTQVCPLFCRRPLRWVELNFERRLMHFFLSGSFPIHTMPYSSKTARGFASFWRPYDYERSRRKNVKNRNVLGLQQHKTS